LAYGFCVKGCSDAQNKGFQPFSWCLIRLRIMFEKRPMKLACKRPRTPTGMMTG
jgi:hypothetical protein